MRRTILIGPIKFGLDGFELQGVAPLLRGGLALAALSVLAALDW
jgi:hypothetical protein